MMVNFPTFVHLAKTSSDCHLSYEPLGILAPLKTLHYVQPCCLPSPYPTKLTALSNTVTDPPVVIENKDIQANSPATNATDTVALQWIHPQMPKCMRPTPPKLPALIHVASLPPPSQPQLPLAFNFESILTQTYSLVDAL
jgi:hypothetical protein